ncbi:MAG TPA: hypothetical protein DEA26_07660 [Oceanospirillales bacterium]|nr:hypothetical protein [Oceanospirillaceae bacterium]HBS42540.1 hypothetical protein [Oceanospirillales bacterium]|tara:strand:+ start:16114 stop:16692 length:579 start_codon:yes stop_codon:yes gene_type:complete
MKAHIRNSLAAAIAALSAVTFHSAQAAEWTGHTSLLLGSKPIAEDDWAKDDEHGAIALITDFRQESWPVSIAVDLFGTGSERKSGDDRYETYTAEAHLGVRKVFDTPTGFQLYLGGGVALINAEQEVRIDGSVRNHDDDTTSGWYGVGTYFALTEHVTVGADVRYVGGEVTLDDRDIDLAGTMGGVSLGFQW